MIDVSQTTCPVIWEQAGDDTQWLNTSSIGGIRGPKSYRGGGWYFLPAWLPDEKKYDVGPFRSKDAAIAEALWLYTKLAA